MQSHINQSESAGPNPVQPTIALAKKKESGKYLRDFLLKVVGICEIHVLKRKRKYLFDKIFFEEKKFIN